MQKIEEKIIQFLFVESILIYIRDLQYRSKIPPPNIDGGKAKVIPSCPWFNIGPLVALVLFGV